MRRNSAPTGRSATQKDRMMANANKKHIGRGTQPKGTGSGAATDIDKTKIEENMVLSNRDKSRHTHERGLDGKQVKTEQYQDHAGNRLADDER
jgi:hypothetical protein